MSEPAQSPPGLVARRIGLLGGPLAAAFCYALLPEQYVDAAGATALFTPAGRAVLSLALWMALWWITEAIPLAATALLPIVVLPLAGAASLGQATTPYSSEVIWLFFGGFLLAGAMQRCGLDRRIAFAALGLVGTRPDAAIGGLMAATAFISMWVSNTATVAMMLPIALGVIDLVARQRNGSAMGTGNAIPPADKATQTFAVALLLCIAYAATIGGMATLVGSPPNGIVARYIAQTYGETISFARWTLIGLPVALVLLLLAWLLVTRVIFPSGLPAIQGGPQWVARERMRLGSWSRGERVVLGVFVATVTLWMTRPLLVSIEIGELRPLAQLSDSGIAVLAALVLFALPAGGGRRAIDWDSAKAIPWDVLILFGGGLSIAAAIDQNGVSRFLGSQATGFAGWPPIVVVLAVVALTTFLSELMSNTALVATMAPLAAALAPAFGVHPYLLVIPVALAASAAFMLPVGTPPNAIVFGTGMLTMGQMCKAGFLLNLCGILLITALAYFAIIPLLVGN